MARVAYAVMLLIWALILSIPSFGKSFNEDIQQQTEQQTRQNVEEMQKEMQLRSSRPWVLACVAYNIQGGPTYRCTQLGWTAPFYHTQKACEMMKVRVQKAVADKAPAWRVTASCYQLKN